MTGPLNVPGLRARIGPLRPFGLLDPVGPPRLDGPRKELAPVEPVGFVGLVNIGVTMGFCELLTDEPVESDDLDEPLGNAGAQLTPGVIVDNWLVTLVDVVEPVPVVPVLPVVCANAVAALRAIAHARPAPPRMGIFRILIKMAPSV